MKREEPITKKHSSGMVSMTVFKFVVGMKYFKVTKNLKTNLLNNLLNNVMNNADISLRRKSSNCRRKLSKNYSR